MAQAWILGRNMFAPSRGPWPDDGWKGWWGDCEAANGEGVRIGGGVAVVRQYLQAGLVDQAHFAITPALLGSGEHVFAGMNLPDLGYDVVERAASESALHVVLEKR